MIMVMTLKIKNLNLMDGLFLNRRVKVLSFGIDKDKYGRVRVQACLISRFVDKLRDQELRQKGT
jgi:hypothetical protein